MTSREKMFIMLGNKNSVGRRNGFRTAKNIECNELTPWENLAAAIVRQSVYDLDYIKKHPSCNAKNGVPCSIYEILNFFRSPWCCLLMQTDDTSELIRQTGIMEQLT